MRLARVQPARGGASGRDKGGPRAGSTGQRRRAGEGNGMTGVRHWAWLPRAAAGGGDSHAHRRPEAAAGRHPTGRAPAAARRGPCAAGACERPECARRAVRPPVRSLRLISADGACRGGGWGARGRLILLPRRRRGRRSGPRAVWQLARAVRDAGLVFLGLPVRIDLDCARQAAAQCILGAAMRRNPCLRTWSMPPLPRPSRRPACRTAAQRASPPAAPRPFRPGAGPGRRRNLPQERPNG